MQQVYTGRNHVEALRFKNFLAQRGIDAEVRTSEKHGFDPAIDESATESAIWVLEDQVTAASLLLSEFLWTFNQSSEEAGPEVESTAVILADERPVVQARIPFLTGLFCAACIGMSIGLWSAPDGQSTEAYMRWGWRDGLDVAEGSYWAIFSSALLHSSVEHLVMNLMGIALLGVAIERHYGHVCWFALMLSATLVSASAELAAIHLSRGDLDAAVKDLTDAIDLEPRTATHYSSRAAARLEQCQYDAALADVDHALWLDPHETYAVLLRGLIFATLTRNERARKDLDEACPLLERDLSRQPRNVWLHWCLVECELGLFDVDPAPARLAKALEHAEQALKVTPDYWALWTVRGTVEFKRKEFARAVDDLSRSLELNPRDFWAACTRGLALHELGRSQDALLDLGKALAVNPRFAYGYRSRAIVLHASGKHREAIEDLGRAIELNSRFAEAYHLRGKFRLAAGEQEGGHADLQNAAELDPRRAGSDVSRSSRPDA
jgi:tetratricopeptide (TPR) repeat protein